MGENWFDGRCRIVHILFQDCLFGFIDPNAFFANINVFSHIVSIKFNDCYVGQFHDNILSPVRSFIAVFAFGYITSTCNFTKIFGISELKRLIIITMFGSPSNGTRTLMSANFKGLISIQRLSLIQCDIANIEEDTFDAMGQTLILIDLSRNKLKRVQMRWFAVYLDKWQNGLKYIIYQDNPIDCNCDYYELRNFTIPMHSFYSPHSNLSIPFRNQCKARIIDPICPNLQEITKDNICLNQAVYDKFSYPKMDLRVLDRTLVAQTTFRLNFRLVIFNYAFDETTMDWKCPTKNWIQTYTRCFLLLGQKNVVSLDYNRIKYDLTTFYVILPSVNKRAWLMHIQTYRTRPHSAVLEQSKFIVILVCSIVGIVFGFVSMIFYVRYFSKHGTVTNSNEIEEQNGKYVSNNVYDVVGNSSIPDTVEKIILNAESDMAAYEEIDIEI